MVTMRIREVLRHLEQDEAELITLQRQNEILKGYLSEVFGPLNPTNLEETLNTTLKGQAKKDKGIGQLDPFLKAC